MIYYYNIRVEFVCGSQHFIKDYTKAFNEIGRFFIELEKRHKDNYTIISIKEKRLYYGGKKTKT